MQTLPFDLISTAQDDSKLVVDASASGYHSLSLHQNPTFRLPNDNSELLKDKRVRQALALAINRPAILNVAISGFGTVGNDQPIPPTHVYGHAGLAPRKRNIDKAKQLLAEAGVQPGTRMILHTTTGRPGLMEHGLAVREMAKAIGLDIAIDAIDISRYWTDIEYRAPMYMDNWGARQTINASIKPFYETGGGNNCAGYSDPALDVVLNRAESEPDFKARKDLYNVAMEMISESAVTIIPYFKGFYIATNKSIGGVSAHPMTYMWLDRAYRKA
jgi:peptide/nickel transport system substrate-binding protein